MSEQRTVCAFDRQSWLDARNVHSSRHIRSNTRDTNFGVWSISCKPKSIEYFTINLKSLI